MARNSQPDLVVLGVGAVVIIGFLIISKFSAALGLPSSAGGPTLLMLLLWVVSLVACLAYLRDWHRYWSPVLFALFWAAWWPAIDVWALGGLPEQFRNMDSFETPWWATGYSKWGGLLLCGVVAYVFSWVLDEQ